MTKYDDFSKSVKENDQAESKRAGYFKFQEGKNNILVLTNPVHFRTAFNIGIVYDESGYNDVASSKYLCYIFDFKDAQIKLMEMSHTIAKSIMALGEGYYTKFTDFPMPYSIEINAVGAGKATVKYTVVAGAPIELSEVQLTELAGLDACEEIIERKKTWQRKQVESDPVFAEKILETAKKIRADREKAKKDKDEKLETIQMDEPDDDDLSDIAAELEDGE